ncbi:SGNH/GDSL hydrolase family protein [Actinoplanes sp. LDG1-06]|uniref:SGNH/GDSL hydrolase family protein n=1 Tax=Paractinoplanes ovalisporus TaxID=2810368 RepID=A0ABS2AGV1_9ACTN|nr:SGNH/GDSL hydrolase family protein [Actinoplanes ovalisporus]MBM2618469.1 SGNH/GDSL hydrolase family protein [Actinoplanes ovalisporus]
MNWTRKTTISVAAALVVLVVAVVVFVRRDSSGNENGGEASPTNPNSATPSTEPSPAENPWTGSWAVAVQNGGRAFEQQTVRQIIRTSIGGETVRVKLSNEFGSDPLTVSAVYLAHHLQANTVDASTNAHVTFSGNDSVTIEAGQTMVSDPVQFSMPAGGDVAVTAYVPERIGSVTQHAFANRHNYVAAGNQATKATLTGAQTFDNYAFLAGVDVQNPASEGAVVMLGASITDGFDSTFAENRRWPDQLARRLLAANRNVGVLNAGISGNMLLKDGAGQSQVNRFDRDVLAQTGVKWVVISDAAINDLGDSNPPSGDQLVQGLQQLIQRGHDAGIKVFCATLTPYKGTDYWSEQGEAGRDAVNDFIKADGSGCDAVIDLDTATHDQSDPQRYNSRYNTGDNLHPNDAGMEAIANAVDLDLFQ